MGLHFRMKNIPFKIKFHPLFYLLLLLAIVTAQFQKVIEFMMIILIHELGHISVASLFHWKVKRVLILPFGGMVELEEKLNRPIYQEFLIAIAGPMTQTLFSFFYLSKFHYPLLFFNLLPIYPLDGAKILFLLFNLFTSYYHSYLILFFCSSFTIFLLLLKDPNLFNFIFFSYLLYQNIRLLGSTPELFLKFLFLEKNYISYLYYVLLILHFPSIYWFVQNVLPNLAKHFQKFLLKCVHSN